MKFISSISRSSGQSVLELALVLPLLATLMLGVVDLCRTIYAYNMISNMSREGANLLSRAVPAVDTPALDFQGVMNSLGNAAPLDMKKNGMMYITQVQGRAGSTTFTTTGWQDHTGPASQVNADSLAAKLGGITIADGDTVYLFEVHYQVDGLILPFFSKSIQSTAIFK